MWRGPQQNIQLNASGVLGKYIEHDEETTHKHSDYGERYWPEHVEHATARFRPEHKKQNSTQAAGEANTIKADM